MATNVFDSDAQRHAAIAAIRRRVEAWQDEENELLKEMRPRLQAIRNARNAEVGTNGKYRKAFAADTEFIRLLDEFAPPSKKGRKTVEDTADMLRDELLASFEYYSDPDAGTED